MATTPQFFWPYQALTDPPNGAALGQNLALAIEGTVSSLNGTVTNHETRIGILETRMGCSLTRAAAQTLPDSAFTPISWDTENVDTNNLFPGSGFTITIPTGGGGIWAISAVLFLPAAPPGLAFLQTNVNGSTVARVPVSSVNDTVSSSYTLPLAAADAIVVQAFADTAAGTTMTASLHCYRIAP